MNQVIKGAEIRKAPFKIKRHTIDANILADVSLESIMRTTKNSFRAGPLVDYSNSDLLPEINGEVKSRYPAGDNYDLEYNALPRIRRKAEKKGSSALFYKTMVDFGARRYKQ
jgi:hypothetical protein